jgi:hypothetical protein
MWDKARAAGHVGSDYANSVLSSAWAQSMDRWLRETVAAKATAASRGMDAEYIRTNMGSGWHRLFDGGHDLVGAWRAIRSATPEDGFLSQLGIYATELWKDLATPNGLPVFTWDKQTFDTVADALQEALGISPDWLRDMASLTATEWVSASRHWPRF